MSGEKPDPGKKMPENNGNIKVLRIPGVLIFWVLLLAVFAGMYFWKGSGAPAVAQWDQTQFEKRIGDVVNAKVVPEEDGMLYVEGEYKLSESELAAAKLKGKNPPACGKFRTRILKNDNIDHKLQQIGNIKVQPRDNWFTSLISLVLPVLIIGIIINLVVSKAKAE